MKTHLIASLVLLGAAISHAHEGDVARVGEKAPAIKCTTIEGTPLALVSLNGKVVLLSFFSTQSVPSMRELEYIERDIGLASPSNALVTVAIGRGHEAKDLAELPDLHHHHFKVVADPKRQIYNLYASANIPRCYVIGKTGLIEYASLGFDEWEIDRIKTAVDAALKK
jgi:peroxiredoxin